MLCPAAWSCLCLVSGLVSQSPSLFFSLGCCVRLPGLVFVLSPVLSPSLPACSSAWDAVSGCLVLSLSCFCLVSQLVSQSASLFFSLGCCVRLPGLVFVLSPVLSPNLCPSLPACSSAWDAASGCLVLFLSCLPTCVPVCQLVLQPGMLCPAPWSCLCFVSGLVSQLVSQSPSLFFSLGCCVRLPGLVFVLSPNLCPSLPACSSAWDAVSGCLVLFLSCLRTPNLCPSLPCLFFSLGC